MSHHKHFLVILLFPITMFLGCGKDDSGSGERPPIPVTATEVVTANVPLYIDTIGRTEAYNSVDIVAQVNGEILDIHFKQGSPVAKGDILFSIDARPYEAALAVVHELLLQWRCHISRHRHRIGSRIGSRDRDHRIVHLR